MTVVNQAPAEVHTPTERSRWRRPRTLTWCAVAIIIVASVIRGVWIFDSWFLTDDFLFTGDIARGVDDLGWYLRIHQGHFMPVSFVLVKIVTVLGSPFVWTAAATEILLLQVTAFVACWWMLRTLFGNRPAVLAGLAFYVFAPLTMPAIMWWAVAINQLPHQIAFFGAIASHVKYCRGRSRRWLIAAAAFLSLGYMSYAKTGLIVIVLAAITMIWFSFGQPWDRLRIALGRYTSAWVTYGVISVAWLVTYLYQTPETEAVPPGGFLDLAQGMIWETFLPTLTGGPWRWDLFGRGPISYTLPPTLLVVLSSVVVLAVVLFSWATRTRSLLILWPVGAYLLISALLVYTGRAYVLNIIGGNTVGRHLQYVSDVAPLITLAIVAMFVPVIGAFDPIRKRKVPATTLTLPRRAILPIVVVLIGGSIYSSHLYAEQWRSFPERTLAQRGIQEVRAERPVFADVGVAPRLMPPLFGERSLIKNFFAPLGDVVQVRTHGNDLAMFDAEGRVAVGGVRAPDSPDLVADPAPVTTCLDVSEVGRWWSVVPPPSFGLWLEVIYQADAATAMTIEAGDEEYALEAQPGRHRVLISTPDPRSTIHVSSGSDQAGLCVTSVRYGLPAPVEGSA